MTPVQASAVVVDLFVADEVVQLLEFLGEFCDHSADRLDAALDRFTGYGYSVAELRADAMRLARRLQRAMS